MLPRLLPAATPRRPLLRRLLGRLRRRSRRALGQAALLASAPVLAVDGTAGAVGDVVELVPEAVRDGLTRIAASTGAALETVAALPADVYAALQEELALRSPASQDLDAAERDADERLALFGWA